MKFDGLFQVALGATLNDHITYGIYLIWDTGELNFMQLDWPNPQGIDLFLVILELILILPHYQFINLVLNVKDCLQICRYVGINFLYCFL